MNTEKEKIVLRVGMNDGIVDGKMRIKNKSFSQILLDASDESILSTGEAIGELLDKEVVHIVKVEQIALSR
ncbi:MAG: DUF1659 domain-containing protein [Tissierellia bacterium]|nr:DUF1659 domain-containing protein [Tissierellia bacterium]